MNYSYSGGKKNCAEKNECSISHAVPQLILMMLTIFNLTETIPALAKFFLLYQKTFPALPAKPSCAIYLGQKPFLHYQKNLHICNLSPGALGGV